MPSIKELAKFGETTSGYEHVPISAKAEQSSRILARYTKDKKVLRLLNDPDNFRMGIIPRLSPYDEIFLPKGAELVRVPKKIRKKLERERSHDLIQWNRPEQFLHRLRIGSSQFEKPAESKSQVFERLSSEGQVVSFDDLRSDSPVPENGRQSRTDINAKIEVNIMGQGRIPFALGSVPDVGSFLSYTTMAISNGMVFASRDKILSKVGEQATMVGDVINFLRSVKLPKELTPNANELVEFASIMKLDPNTSNKKLLAKYYETLRNSWIANVGAAVEASPKSAVERAQALYENGCRLFRIYSPEGGREIVDTTIALRETFKDDENVKIVAGQVMDLETAINAEKAGANAMFIGVAGGSQCTTSVNADIPVKTPNLLEKLRGKIGIPVGIEGGGVGTHLITAFNLGASFVSKPGEIGVSWEGSGGKLIFRDKKGRFYMPYGGEASISAKWWKHSVDSFGRPKFVEGETDVRQIRPDNMSQTRNIKRLRDEASVGLVFQRANTIAELHARDCSNIVQVSPNASSLSVAYGDVK